MGIGARAALSVVAGAVVTVWALAGSDAEAEVEGAAVVGRVVKLELLPKRLICLARRATCFDATEREALAMAARSRTMSASLIAKEALRGVTVIGPMSLFVWPDGGGGGGGGV